jgi:H+/Cl- antiporter ClcA
VKLVDDWRNALKWFSVNVHAANVAFLVTWANLPQKFQDSLPLPWVIGIAVGLLVLGVVGRLVDQGGAKQEPKP